MTKKQNIISPLISLLIISVFLSSNIQALSANNPESDPTPSLQDMQKKVIQTDELTPSLLSEDFGNQNTFWVWPWVWEPTNQYQINATLLVEGVEFQLNLLVFQRNIRFVHLKYCMGPFISTAGRHP